MRWMSEIQGRVHRRLSGLIGGVRRFARDTGGGVMIWTGIGLPVLLGVSGLGLDTSLWYLERRVMQSAVDTAAISAALAKAGGGDADAINAAVNKALTDNKFTIVANDILSVNIPPTSGPNTGNATAVEIVVRRKAKIYLSKLIQTNAVHIRTRAVAGAVVVGKHCIVALDETADRALEFTGTATANINCGVASNSKSNQSIYVGGNASLTADPAQAKGDIYVGGSATLVSNTPPQPYSSPVPDPFGPEGRDLQMPMPAACVAWPAIASSGTTTLTPNNYCGDLTLSNKNVTFAAGTYVIDGGDLKISSNSVVSGDGVTFIFTAANPEDVGTIDFTANSEINLTAPNSGDYAGVLVFEDPSAAQAQSSGVQYKHVVLGGADTHLKGAIYARNREIEFTGGSSAASQCLYLVGRKVTITGSVTINNDAAACSALGLDDIQQVRIKLVE